MKKGMIFLTVLAFLLTFAACSRENDGQGGATTTDPIDTHTEGQISTSSNVGTTQQEGGQTERHDAVLHGKIAEVEEDSILLMCEKEGLLFVSLQDAVLYGPEHDEIAADMLRAGMQVEIAYNGFILETYPGKPGDVSSLIVQSEDGDLVGFYADVIEDLYQTDPGLNEGITKLAFDFHNISNLTEVEKDALVYMLGCRYQVEPIAGTYEELCELGYIDGETLSFKDGLLFTIEVTEKTNSESFTFNAKKWRGGDGAYFFAGCEAVCQNGAWQYTVGSEMIS